MHHKMSQGLLTGLISRRSRQPESAGKGKIVSKCNKTFSWSQASKPTENNEQREGVSAVVSWWRNSPRSIKQCAECLSIMHDGSASALWNGCVIGMGKQFHKVRGAPKVVPRRAPGYPKADDDTVSQLVPLGWTLKKWPRPEGAKRRAGVVGTCRKAERCPGEG